MGISPRAIKGSLIALCVTMAFGCCTSMAAAGALATTPLALPGWQGTNVSLDLDDGFGGLFADGEGSVDYAVFGPGKFALYLAANSLTPVGAAPPNDLVIYAFQIFDVVGPDGISNFSVSLDNLAPRIAPSEALALGDVESQFNGDDQGDSMYWTWGAPNGLIGVGQSSGVLYYGSPNLPKWGNMELTAGGLASTDPDPAIPTVGPLPVPEPSSLLLVAIGAGLFLLRRSRR